jgi:hypothetical protein
LALVPALAAAEAVVDVDFVVVVELLPHAAISRAVTASAAIIRIARRARRAVVLGSVMLAFPGCC